MLSTFPCSLRTRSFLFLSHKITTQSRKGLITKKHLGTFHIDVDGGMFLGTLLLADIATHVSRQSLLN